MLKNTTTNSSLVIIPFVLCLFIPRRNVIKPHVVVLRVVKCCCCLLVTSGLAPWFLGLHANLSNHLLGHGSIINLLVKLFSSNWPYCINNVFFLKDKSTNFKHQNLSTGIGEYHCMCCWSCPWWEAGGWVLDTTIFLLTHQMAAGNTRPSWKVFHLGTAWFFWETSMLMWAMTEKPRRGLGLAWIS